LFVGLEHALNASSARWCVQLLPPFTTLSESGPGESGTHSITVISKKRWHPHFVPKADVSNRSKAGFSIAELIEPERAI
jgi:hypothetical protein